MSRCNEYKDQVIELDFLYPSEGIHRRWDEGEYLHKHRLPTLSCCSCQKRIRYSDGDKTWLIRLLGCMILLKFARLTQCLHRAIAVS